ncbi:hypothetical protein BDU57DRAFT_458037 [Ampelomyces quisqualis]|uniref:RING-type domain-containing protein n=1 Tax=Ampelomyces quisqualis TaxID=50730 RepID=A0A6A5QC49_AMPQU|nr:hypothetical protein BDU57DRAFT_458037 [Ampelomyces quisqualis]
MFDINSYRPARLSDTYHSYQHIFDISDHHPDPLANCCCICYNPYRFATMDPEAEDPVQLPCGHVFGEMCVFLWAETSNTCPMCRAELDLQNDTDADMLIFEHSSSQGQMDIDGESQDEYFDAQERCADDECEAEYFDAQESCADSHHHSCEDSPLGEPYPALEKYAYPVDLVQAKDSHFDELIKCHEKWMITSFDDDDDYDSEDEFAVTYFDVFPY